MTGDRSVLDLGGSFAQDDIGGDVPLRPVPRAFTGLAQRPTGSQAGHQLTLERAASLDVERLVNRLVADAHVLMVGEVDDQPSTDLLRAPGRRPAVVCTVWLVQPFPGRRGPAATVPSGRRSCPLSRVCTYSRNHGLLASFAGLGRRAVTCAFHCATVARYSRLPLRVAALRRSSREIVPGSRLSSRAIARTPCPAP